MAIFHLHVKNISRGGRGRDGARPRSALAAAAYRAGESLWNEAEEKETKFGGRRDVVHAEIRVPEGAPAWMRTRASLWNGAEAAEKRKDARLAKEIEFALPRELTRDTWLRITREIADAYVSKGLVVDLAIHEDGRGHNPHAHLMLTTREITPDGFGPKLRWMDTDTFVNQARAQWERIANASLASAGLSPIDARSHAVRDLQEQPGQHRGPNAEERRDNRETAAMMRTQSMLTDMITRLDDRLHAYEIDAALGRQTDKLRAEFGELKLEMQALMDQLVDTLVDAGILKRDAAAAYLAMQRRVMDHEDYTRARQNALGIEFYSGEPRYTPTRADQRTLEAYERSVQQEEWDALDRSYAAEAGYGSPSTAPNGIPAGDPVPDPDGNPISPSERDEAEDRMLADQQRPVRDLPADKLPDGVEREAARAELDRINAVPVPAAHAYGYRLPSPGERLSLDQIRAAVKAPRTHPEEDRIVARTAWDDPERAPPNPDDEREDRPRA
ncbi:MobA/MobL family protein [Aureimonas phyllosphaerae]|uniref:MobA/MobL protein domain-containing protein n=1 Tax=Aureimonas phyllosphaerae TaxID=1166078 RepID=A0A7W6BU31_9HYPH|nr:MobA/MobL family protein [Aureimonas phyllosphaerae]MBB3938048.1 hypothetical protein [Aureimonas phyllosphaerae]MBB3962076.1 hypothetical protein [Aureimonas phyllosphaerae]SFF55031.1 MobA/MobL family protein [Aureimonas phyllosphaerae]